MNKIRIDGDYEQRGVRLPRGNLLQHIAGQPGKLFRRHIVPHIGPHLQSHQIYILLLRQKIRYGRLALTGAA
ncbi:hypothetical protein D3C87_2121180 [compost metagenome]